MSELNVKQSNTPVWMRCLPSKWKGNQSHNVIGLILGWGDNNSVCYYRWRRHAILSLCYEEQIQKLVNVQVMIYCIQTHGQRSFVYWFLKGVLNHRDQSKDKNEEKCWQLDSVDLWWQGYHKKKEIVFLQRFLRLQSSAWSQQLLW